MRNFSYLNFNCMRYHGMTCSNLVRNGIHNQPQIKIFYLKVITIPCSCLCVQLFTVTRNPWHRLESVWRDRFGSLDGEQQQKWMKGFCRGKSWPSLPPFRYFSSWCGILTCAYLQPQQGNTMRPLLLLFKDQPLAIFNLE